MKILARISKLDIVTLPFKSLMGMLIGKNVINNPKAIRYKDLKTDNIIFYEEENELY